MNVKIELTESEAQYLRDILLKQMKLLADVLGTSEAEKYLRKIDKAHAYDIYKKLG
jgi:hypothetical protein